MYFRVLLSLALTIPSVNMCGMQPFKVDPKAQDDWFIQQIPKGQPVSDPAVLQRLKGDIEKVKQYQKSFEYKLQLFGKIDSLQKIQKQMATVTELLTNLQAKSWLPMQKINAAIAACSKLEQTLSGYIHNPQLIDTELADLSVPAVYNRVQKLVTQWADSLKQVYQLSVLDSQAHIPGKEYTKLISVTPWNKQLIFDTQGRVLVTSWVPDYLVKFYTVGQTKTIQDFIPWVSVVPELKKFAQDYVKNNEEQTSGFSLYERIAQLLGLPQLLDGVDVPRSVIEMWVDPQDLVRPCLDTGVVNRSCALDTQDGNVPQTFQDMQVYVPANDEKISWLGSKQPAITTRAWFNQNKGKTYTGAYAFPWTRLGYTYDIGSMSQKKAGLSEFLIKPGATVLIESITPTNLYPNSPEPKSAFKYQGPAIQD